MNKIALRLKKISKYYHQGGERVDVLSDVDLTIYAGELVAIIGASGSGKSTLLHIAGLMDSPSSGNIYFDDNNIHLTEASDCDSLRLNYIGFVYQHHHLLKDFTAYENIILPQRLNNIDKLKAQCWTIELLNSLKISHRAKNYPGEMSGGEQQRGAIARAFANKPTIILADEPTGNLDPQTADEVFNLFYENAKKNNIATVIVTHNYDLAFKMDKVYLLENKKLILKT